MKILSKEEEQAHYNATVKGGLTGGAIGLAVGISGIGLATRRYHAFRQLTVPFRVFLASSSATFCAIIAADRSSRGFELSRHAEERRYIDKQESMQEQIDRAKPTAQRVKDWVTTNRYPLLFGAWVASMGGSWYLVNRNPYLTGAQKLVQARVYAQGLTVGLLVGSFALESRDAVQGKGRWETVKILDPNDPTHRHLIEKRIHHERYAGEDQWMDMVAAEEAKLKEREERNKKHETTEQKTSNNNDQKKSNNNDQKKSNNTDEKKTAPEQKKEEAKAT